MILRKLGTSELEITPVIMGTWAIGGWLWGGTEKNRGEAAIRATLDSGVNCIDTAPAYGFGLSEEIVGKAIKGRRDDVLVATKCGLVWDDRPRANYFFDTKDNSGRPLKMFRCLTKKSIIKECEDSLRRLQVDVIDLYQCHWPDPENPIEEAMEALMELRDQGKIRAIGVSNFSKAQMQECLKYVHIASDQPKYSLLSRDIEDEILGYCGSEDIGVIAYSSMEMGLLTGKIGLDHEFVGDDTRKNRPWFQKEKLTEVLDALAQIKPIADKYNATLGQISIAWIIAQPHMTAAIVGARNEEQARSNATAANIVLEPEDEKTIRDVFSRLVLDETFDPATAKR